MPQTPSRKLVLGFDIQPNRLGWAYVNINEKEEKYWDIYTKKSGCFTFADFTEDRFYWQQVDTAVLKVLEQVDRAGGEPLRFYIEQPYLLSVKIAYRYGYAMAYLRESLERYEPEVGIEWFQPSEWKKHGLGNGRATKEEIMVAAKQYGFHPINQDAADASIIAIAGSSIYDGTTPRLPKDDSKELPRLQDIESWG